MPPYSGVSSLLGFLLLLDYGYGVSVFDSDANYGNGSHVFSRANGENMPSSMPEKLFNFTLMLPSTDTGNGNVHTVMEDVYEGDTLSVIARSLCRKTNELGFPCVMSGVDSQQPAPASLTEDQIFDAIKNRYNVLRRGFLFDRLSKVCLAQNRSVRFVQVGAMDGVDFDPLFAHVNKYRWRGVLVEPMPDHFAHLQRNYQANYPALSDQLVFVNVAISTVNGVCKMRRVNYEAVQNGTVPNWAAGVSMLDNSNSKLLDSALLKNYVVEVSNVNCTSLAALFDEHAHSFFRAQPIDVLQLDTEGFDYKIFMQYDFDAWYGKPAVISLESAHLSDREELEVVRKLATLGYTVNKVEIDIIASVLPELVQI